MPHTKVLEQFNEMFPFYETDVWFSNGRNSIRIRTKSGLEYVFTFISDIEWRLETVDFHINNVQGKYQWKK